MLSIALLLAPLPFPSELEGAASAVLFRSHVEFLASDELRGRRAGTLDADRAARYVASEFGRLGLEPAGEGGTYFQEFVVPLDAVPGPETAVAFASGDGAFEPLPGFATPLSPSSPGALEGEAVFAGYGISDPGSGRDDYADLDVAGRVVLVLRGTPEAGGEDPHAELPVGASIVEKVANAKAHGAAALLLCNGAFGKVEEEEERVPFDPSATDGGIPALQIADEAAVFLARAGGLDLAAARDSQDGAASRRIERVRLRVRADVDRRTAPSRNVIGLLRGARPAAGTVVVGAHYDHLGLGGAGSLARDEGPAIHNGADDNASGTAGLLEIARLLAPRREDLERSILLVAFGGEELGLLGSERLVAAPPLLPGPFAAMVNLDMIGRARDGAVEVIGAASSPRFAPLVERAAEGLDLAPKLSSGLGAFGGSDHLSFYHAGVPVVFFFTGAHPDYHRPSDDADRVRFEEGTRVATLAARVAHGLAASEEAIPFEKVRVPAATMGGGAMRSSLGTIPDYASEPGGLRLAGVSEGGAAEKAALRRGDVIRRVGEIRIEGIQDLMLALRRYRAGERVEVEFEREGETRTVEVEMGAPRGR